MEIGIWFIPEIFMNVRQTILSPKDGFGLISSVRMCVCVCVSVCVFVCAYS